MQSSCCCIWVDFSATKSVSGSQPRLHCEMSEDMILVLQVRQLEQLQLQACSWCPLQLRCFRDCGR